MAELVNYPDHIKFRLSVDEDHEGPFTFITEWSGLEISVEPGTWVDVEVDNGDGTPAQVHVHPGGDIAVFGRRVVVTGEDGELRTS
ncbi:hypothetical protein ACFWNN_13900 [Lentzea sp. NPDC058450]|uniref:hypothetical protein n=1 Tax=Lentzea sp. NPDC058450 TaxID=3346505 RepID=UPI003663E8C4